MFSRFLAGTALSLALLATPQLFAAETKTVEVKGDDYSLTLKMPEGWQEKTPGPLRKAQFEVPAVEGDKEVTEVIVSHFGKGGGGGVQPNIERWVKQFDADERKVKILEGESKQGKYTLVELSGTWNKSSGPMTKSTKIPSARMLAVILHSEKHGNFFIRLNGPEKTVTANAKAFREAFGADIEKEKEVKDSGAKKE